MTERKVHRLWKPIAFGEEWRGADTSILDDLSSSWFARKARLRLESKEYQAFLDRLKREHAIETGVVERLYDIDRGVTETLIQQGFVDGLLSHGDANIPSDQLMLHLKDHLEAMDFVFDLIKENRPLTVGFIKELHQLVTRSQQSAEGRDGLGNRIKIPLLRGDYKERENNPTRSDGTVILYCDPVHVASEMDQLVNIYHVLEDEKVHPLIIASWVHHAFTTIHPFQDGNGRVVRLLASLILIKHDLFPITVLREEARVKYIAALERADEGEPSDLVAYFATIQKRQIERALNFEEVGSLSLHEVSNLLSKKLSETVEKAEEKKSKLLRNRTWLFDSIVGFFEDQKESLHQKLGSNAIIYLQARNFGQDPHPLLVEVSDRYLKEALNLAKSQKYIVNLSEPTSWFNFGIRFPGLEREYSVIFVLHHYGKDDSTMAISSFVEEWVKRDGVHQFQLANETAPHIFSILDEEMEDKKKNIIHFLENLLIVALARIVADL